VLKLRWIAEVERDYGEQVAEALAEAMSTGKPQEFSQGTAFPDGIIAFKSGSTVAPPPRLQT